MSKSGTPTVWHSMGYETQAHLLRRRLLFNWVTQRRYSIAMAIGYSIPQT
jgi:hypothetical protein